MSYSSASTIIKRAFFALTVLALASYAFFQARTFLEGPRIVVVEPQSGSVITEASINVTGYARNISRILFNGRAIAIDEEGRFSERLLLPEGYTILTLEAEDRFGRATKRVLKLVRMP